MSEVKTHWKSLQEGREYLGHWDFQPGEEKTLTIKEVKKELVYDPSTREKEPATVGYFQDAAVKPMILNSTNQAMIEKVTGSPYIEDWAGEEIVLHVEKVQAFGERRDAIRVMNRKPIKIECEGCGKLIKYAAGKRPDQLAEISMRNTGKKLCLECMRKWKEENS